MTYNVFSRMLNPTQWINCDHLSGLPGWAGSRRSIHPVTYPDHHPTFIIFFQLLWSIASSLSSLHAWQSFCTTSFHVLFDLPLGLEPSTSYSMHFFTQSMSSFLNTCPYHCSLFCCSTNIISYIPSLSQLFTWHFIFYLNITHPSDQSHLCSLKCHLTETLTGRSWKIPPHLKHVASWTWEILGTFITCSNQYPSAETRIGRLRFQAGCRKRRLNLVLVCVYT